MTIEQPSRAPRLHGWRHGSIIAAASLAMAAGFAQFSVTSALPDVAAEFGEITNGTDIASQIGLSATTIGLGQAIIRLASITSLPLSASADRFGRRRVLLATAAFGLAAAATAALSPGFWWFVIIFAFSRGPLSTTNAMAGVIAAEETRSIDRAKAIALITAGYGVGAGLTGIIRAIGGESFGFRPLFGLALVPLLLLPVIARHIHEPSRFVRTHERVRPGLKSLSLAPLERSLRGRFAVVASMTFSMAFLLGPVNANLFVYAENILGLSRLATAGAVIAAGPLGLFGLLLGRWTADRFGRRWTAMLAHAAIAISGGIAYGGGTVVLLAGYLVSLTFSSVYAPAGGALATELFPTRVRGTITGWIQLSSVIGAVTGLFTFGALVDAFDGYGAASLTIAVPVLLSTVAYLRLPETKGLELEESAPEDA